MPALFGARRAAILRPSGVVVPAPLVSSYRDDFTTGTQGASLDGRSYLGNTYTSVIETGGVNNTVPTLDGVTGRGFLKGGSGFTKTHAYRNPTTTTDYAVDVAGSAVSTLGMVLEDDVATAGTTFNGFRLSLSTASSLVPIVAGVSGTTLTNPGQQLQDRDVVERRTFLLNGTYYRGVWINGLQFGSLTVAPWVDATFTASLGVGTNVMTVTAVASGTIQVGHNVGTSSAPLLVTGQISGTTGSTGTYSVTCSSVADASLGLASQTMKAGYGYLNYTVAGLTPTGRHGWGNVNGDQVDSHEGGDMTVVSRIMVILYARTVQVSSDGTVTMRVKFSYTGRAPTTIKYRIHTSSDGAVAFSGTGTSLTTDDTTKIGYVTLGAFTPASLSTGYWPEIYREDAVDYQGTASVIAGVGPSVVCGNVILSDGQSLAGNMDSGTTTLASWAAPTNPVFQITASITDVAVTVKKTVLNTAQAAIFDTGILATKPGTYISGPVGGTAIALRGVGTPAARAVIAAVEASGGKLLAANHIDGQSDVGLVATYASGLTALYADRFTRWGNFIVSMFPLGADQGSSDAACESMRRYQGFELPAADSRFIQGPFYYDLQHITNGSTTVDALHVALNLYDEMARRNSWILSNTIDAATYTFSRRGPSIASVARIDAQTVAVTFNLNGFTGLSAVNTGVTTGKTDVFNCGMRFGTTVGTVSGLTKGDGTTALTTLTNYVAATSVNVGVALAGQIIVTFGFALNSFPGTVYVGGPYGSNPFNRSNDLQTNIAMATKASMLLGTFGTEPTVPIQPFWQTSGADYLSAS